MGPSCHQAETGNGESTATSSHLNSDVPTTAFAYCTKLQMVLWPHHTFLISSHTVALRIHHDKKSYFTHAIVSWHAFPRAEVSSHTIQAFKTSLKRVTLLLHCNNNHYIVITITSCFSLLLNNIFPLFAFPLLHFSIV